MLGVLPRADSTKKEMLRLGPTKRTVCLKPFGKKRGAGDCGSVCNLTKKNWEGREGFGERRDPWGQLEKGGDGSHSHVEKKRTYQDWPIHTWEKKGKKKEKDFLGGPGGKGTTS